jgi:hypothetical protein
MEDPKVKTILTSELQTTNKLLDDNNSSKELVFHNEMDHGIQNEKSMIHKSKTHVLTQLTNVST